jgi:hypothetical protein
MIKHITYIAPHKTALTVSIIFAAISLLMIVPMVLSFVFMPATDAQGNPVDSTPLLGMIIIMPVIYFIFSYLFTAFAAWLYNKIAAFTGGITYESEGNS